MSSFMRLTFGTATAFHNSGIFSPLDQPQGLLQGYFLWRLFYAA
jgi:hypothetical protein